MQNFQELRLNNNLNAALIKMKFDTPTPIQVKSIPLILDKKDILASAHTGTGKTAAFCIPMIELIAQKKTKKAIILVPTRELAKQVNEVIEKLLFQQSIIKSVCLVGGEQMGKQLKRLKKGPQIIVGTPGRVNDHLKRKSLILKQVDLLILDEMDRMLDMGFSFQIDEVIKYLPKEKQTLMFSATIASSIERLSLRYLSNAERVSVASASATLVTIKQEVIRLRQDEKYPQLVEQIKTKHGSTLVFVKTKHNAKKLAKNLSKEGFEADALHGNLRQSKRNIVINKFRANKIHILVATDIAARGLDIPHIEHVINYDLPQQAEDFIHRMGRTGRAGALGTAWSFVTPNDKKKWNEIIKIINPGLKSSSDKKIQRQKKVFRKDYKPLKYKSRNFNQKRLGNKNKSFFRKKEKKRPFKDYTSVEFKENSHKKSKIKNEGYGRKNKLTVEFSKKPNHKSSKPSLFRGNKKKKFKSKEKSSDYGKKSSLFIGGEKIKPSKTKRNDSSTISKKGFKSSRKSNFNKHLSKTSKKSFRFSNNRSSKKNF